MKTMHFTDHNGKVYNYTESMWLVTSTDKVMSGWGRAEGKICKRIIVCKDREQAFRISDNMRKRGFIYVSCRVGRIGLPYYNPSRYVVCAHYGDDCPIWNK